MNHYHIILAGCLLLGAWGRGYAQSAAVLSAAGEEQLESSTVTPEDDTRWQQLNAYTRRPLDLNTAGAADLRSLDLLTPLQVSALLRYRHLLGKLVSIYELQAVPGFDAGIINRLLPYVTVAGGLQPQYTLRDYLHKGGHALLVRYGRQLELPRGYIHTDTTAPHYAGSPDQLLLRYRYNLPGYASWGVIMQKDAGEQFFKGAQRQGFDFYSAHLFIRNYKHIKALALGDFTVNMGQGLINWQSLAFGKSPVVLQVKREGEVLNPYASAGEFYFFRGAGITLQQHIWQVTGFVSLRSLDGNTGETADTLTGTPYISAFATTGYHRSALEAAKRGVLQQLTAGGSIVYDNGNWRMGVNVIQHKFSVPVQKSDALYNLFAPEGSRIFNAGFDYSGTWRNVHCFGETAVDAHGRLATVNGLLATVHPRVDVALLYRFYDRAYQSLYSNAFGNSYRPVNESGWYTAVTLRLTPHLKWEGYADLFRFPWLRYRMNMPGANGRELLASLTYTPDKQTEAFIRYSHKSGWENYTGSTAYIAPVVPVSRRSWRWQVSMSPGRQWKLRSRVELNHYTKAADRQQGWLCFQELQYRCTTVPVRLSGRLTWFSTSGSGSTVYAIESNMLYNNSVMQLNGDGWQYSINIRYNLTKRLAVWLRWNQVTYRNTINISSGWEEVNGRQKSIIQLQAQQLF
ncbi:MAG TPA: helix-hairpin-helix domain-containing protein [Chitinophaga sp.]|uniref:ComEA family DNA-binding protein n=1 Tax=Chitinophaga sp. TaxID=1869181 RepID=UPI002DB58196|nr:helix-hairpin-helix domain-containing protein [Chitinophaga sp.]HEU4552486.1 helix-hairpin-helix domain-containing protein [Chitinophaga sp.]